MATVDQRKLDTAAIVEGGSYRLKVGKDAEGEPIYETGTMQGTSVDSRGEKHGRLYTFTQGKNPITVTEGRENFAGWELFAAPSKAAAKQYPDIKTPEKAQPKKKG
jgi:hypothetical protein